MIKIAQTVQDSNSKSHVVIEKLWCDFYAALLVQSLPWRPFPCGESHGGLTTRSLRLTEVNWLGFLKTVCFTAGAVALHAIALARASIDLEIRSKTVYILKDFHRASGISARSTGFINNSKDNRLKKDWAEPPGPDSFRSIDI